MVAQGTDLCGLREPNVAEVEVLGGNHSREALQALYRKGSLEVETVKVNIYRPLPQTSALAVGYQHNFLLHEKRRTVTFLDKVRLMRECRSKDRTEAQWKDMLVVIFRLKDRSTLQRSMTHHLLMAKPPEKIWSMVVRYGDVNEKFYRTFMRLDDEGLQETCIGVLLADGQEKFKSKVKDYISMGHTRSKKKKPASATNLTEDIPTESIDDVQTQLDDVTAKYEELKARFSSLQQENEQMKEELEKIKSTRGSKRQRDNADDEFSAGEVIKAFWRDDSGESWLDATVFTAYSDGKTYKVKYHVDSGIARLARSWLRKA